MAAAPSLIVHTKAVIVNRITSVFKQIGFNVIYSNYGEAEVIAHQDCLHLIWGCPYKPDAVQRIAAANHGQIFWIENGWLTQSSGCYIDPKGTNADSSLVGAVHDDSIIDASVIDWIDTVHSWHDLDNDLGGLLTKYPDYIFVPLQTEHDTQIMYHSAIDLPYLHRQRWLLDQIARLFPDRHIVVRQHPRAPGTLEAMRGDAPHLDAHPNVHYHGEGNSYQWCMNAAAVIGVNSTVLTEAVTFGTPTAHVGRGIMSGNGVMLDCTPDAGGIDRLAELPAYMPDPRRILQYLSLLKQRQVTWNLTPDNMTQYPVLNLMVERGRALPGTASLPLQPVPQATFATGRAGMLIYGCLHTDAKSLPEHRDVDLSQQLANLLCNHADGLVILAEDGDPVATLNSTIPFLTVRNPGAAEDVRIKKLIDRGLTSIAVGNAGGEWMGDRDAFERYADFADRLDFKWWCPITHACICSDLQRPPNTAVRQGMVERSVPGMCFCGQVLLGYVHADMAMPHQGFDPRANKGRWTSLSGVDLYEKYGMCFDSLKEWLSGIFVITGGGGAEGVEHGSLVYARRVGFRGAMIRPPFRLDGRFDMEVNPPAKRPPTRCGVPECGYVDRMACLESDRKAVAI